MANCPAKCSVKSPCVKGMLALGLVAAVIFFFKKKSCCKAGA
ncbi:conserved hypothetical protein [Gluconacetobacter diazotrophicus PA1 5]|uniref:Putative membrane protein n=1 Tax=Gluconacetobacter diazotrophicus (strain ATCC 49037 / DSM 5601 / CCUG 37298 / CIP 103539 / LMG 7603 / PAl5) TaxID=272568 RepID=A9HB69_GLUDA|nr:conserved hypothetical protein [Gluconacetobacter diazotrophicus PA1 5]TWB08576.1 hypothetical protein FBZ86_10673 [Gluconacetobacter diazotrophicus]CAP54774.1 putative membrane protein [Gluconacetobacter diazotrophicus PA1 5]